jgi:histidine ammonia-lyase
MGTIAARDARSIVELAENIAAVHLIAVCQALELRGVEKMSPRTRAAYDLLRSHVSFLEGDRRMDKDIQITAELIRGGELARAAGIARR